MSSHDSNNASDNGFRTEVHAAAARDWVACISGVYLTAGLAFEALRDGEDTITPLRTLDHACRSLYRLEAGASAFGFNPLHDTDVSTTPLLFLRAAALALAGDNGEGFLREPFDAAAFQSRVLLLATARALVLNHSPQLQRQAAGLPAEGQLADADLQLLLQRVGLAPETTADAMLAQTQRRLTT